jgi:uncharacterized RDD family membrane protein YckC
MTDSSTGPEGEIPKAPPITGMPEANPVDANLATYGLRLVGYLIDGLIVGVAFVVIAVAAAGLDSTLLTIVASFAGFLYAGLLIGGWNGQTVGMKAMGIRCVNGADASKVEYSTSFLRAFIHAIFQIIPIVVIVDLLWPLWDKRNQTLHDKVASTIVIKD